MPSRTRRMLRALYGIGLEALVVLAGVVLALTIAFAVLAV